ncbi:MAG: DUF2892 domain-containing protein [Bdellovibrionales bacterium]|nr:DUF2892 domain-containing protein [Bdellovibrionales bacterium]
MSNERIIRIVAGFMIIMSLSLSQLHHPYWLFLTLFVGFNLFQSGFTQVCPLNNILNLARKSKIS